MAGLFRDIYLYSDGVELPERGTYYVVTRTGYYLHKENGLLRALVAVGEIPFLEDLVPFAKLAIPKLPVQCLASLVKFYRTITRTKHTEACVMIYYSRDKNEYSMYCPEQTVTAASIHYEQLPIFENDEYVLVIGTHSHNDFNAFHSGVDRKDQCFFDGLHFCFGDLGSEFFSVSASIVINNNRFHVKPEEYVEGLRRVEWQSPLPSYFGTKRVSRFLRKSRSVQTRSGESPVSGKESGDWLFPLTEPMTSSEYAQPKKAYYTVDLPKGVDWRNIAYPRTWNVRVKPGYMLALAPEDEVCAVSESHLNQDVGQDQVREGKKQETGSLGDPYDLSKDFKID